MRYEILLKHFLKYYFKYHLYYLLKFIGITKSYTCYIAYLTNQTHDNSVILINFTIIGF